MDDQSPLLNWAYCCPEKGTDELRQSLVLTREVEDTRLKAQEELKMRDEQIVQLKSMLCRTIKERDEAQYKCQKLFFEKLLLQNHSQNTTTSIEDEPRIGMDSINGFSSSDCDESTVSSPPQVVVPQRPPTPPPQPPSEELLIMPEKPLPIKGKLLQAVIEAGPLLQTLLLAGPLPQWRHPPPPLDTHQIPPPPAVIPAPPLEPAHSVHQESLYNVISTSSIDYCGRMDGNRGLCLDSEPSIQSKYQAVGLLH